MTRDLISFETLFSTVAKQQGYTSYYCSTPSLMPNVQSVPAVVIYPSEVNEKVGISRCRITSKITFLTIKTGVAYSYDEKMSTLNEMQLDVLQMVQAIEANVNIAEVTDLQITVDDMPLMHSDDLQLRTTVTIVSNFSHTSSIDA